MRGLVALVILVLGVIPAAAAPPEQGMERGQFALAGWSSIDEQTGEEHFRMIQAGGPVDGTATVVSYNASDVYPILCPGGEPGTREVETGGEGTGAFEVRRNLGGATLAAVVEVEVITWIRCEDGGEPDVSRKTLELAFDLAGTGPRWQESNGSFRRIPSVLNEQNRARAIGRDATGTFTVGDVDYPVVFGDFGRVTGKWRYSTEVGAAAATLRSWLPARALAEAGTEVGRLDRAGAIWERSGEDTYRGVFVGADRVKQGETTVFMDGYASRTIRCEDGTTAAVETFRSGEGAGSLTTGGNYKSAAAQGRIDITTIVVNGCTGETVTSLKTGVRVGLALTASGPVFHGGEWSALLVPRQGKTRVSVRWTGRDAAGSLTVGSTRYEGTTWGEIGTLRWWEHLPRQGG